jgi:hypothetical protein
MNRYIQILAKANAILFSFVIPFTVVYMRQERMYLRTAELHVLYAAEMTEKEQAALVAFKASTTAAKAQRLSTTAQKTSSPKKVSLSSTYAHVPVGAISSTQAFEILPVIAQCESGGDPLAKNKTSSAKGYLQIINGTWQHFNCSGSVLNKDDNLACGIKIATESGLHHWNESRACWAPKLQSGQSKTLLTEL